jgi:opacity protein-like surface antigen
MLTLSNHVLILATLSAFSFAPSTAWAQDAAPSNQAEPPPATLSDEEERWAAEKEPSQLGSAKTKPSLEANSIHADIILALRSGYGVAGGKIAEGGSDLADVLAGQVPLQLDFGVLLESGAYFGAFAQYGFSVLGSRLADSCDEAERRYPGTEVSCSAFDVRAGVVLEYHLGAGKKRKAADPWLGLGIGFEHVSWKVAAKDEVSEAIVTQSASGFEFVSGHFGVDFALADWFALGPYLSVTMGSYGSADVSCAGDCEGVGTGSPVINQSLHTWTFFGAKALFQIAGPRAAP